MSDAFNIETEINAAPMYFRDRSQIPERAPDKKGQDREWVMPSDNSPATSGVESPDGCETATFRLPRLYLHFICEYSLQVQLTA